MVAGRRTDTTWRGTPTELVRATSAPGLCLPLATSSPGLCSPMATSAPGLPESVRGRVMVKGWAVHAQASPLRTEFEAASGAQPVATYTACRCRNMQRPPATPRTTAGACWSATTAA